MSPRPLLGLAPTRRFVFSAEDAARYKLLVEAKLAGWGIDVVRIDPVNSGTADLAQIPGHGKDTP